MRATTTGAFGRSDRRGYVGFSLSATELQARLMAVQRPDDAKSAVDVMAQFVVPLGRPGAVPA